MISTAAALLARFRLMSPITAEAQRTNSKSPIAEPDQQIVRDHIRKTGPAWLAVFHDLSTSTGWRTSDCIGLTFDCIDWNTGRVTITVAKQTKSAQARAMGKALEAVRTARKQASIAEGNAAAYMRWDSCSRDDIAASMTEQEQQQAAQVVAAAPRKVDTKQIPGSLLKRLAAMKAANIWDSFIFTRRLTRSNRSISMEGCIARGTVWQLYRQTFDQLADKLTTAARQLSAYSTRKTFAASLLRKTNNIAVVMQAFGHSSVQMTMKYLGLESEAETAQAAMAMSMEA